jgi:hypothetical protein
VLTRVALPRSPETTPLLLEARASLGNERIRPSSNGQLVSESQEIGFAMSQAYKLDSPAPSLSNSYGFHLT